MYKKATRFLQQRRERGFLTENDQVPEYVRNAFDRGTHVRGTVYGRVKGGFFVELDDCDAFCPASEMYPRFAATDDLSTLRRRELKFAILKIGIRNVVVSRLRAARADALHRAHAALKRRRSIEGTVERVMPYGAFVDLGGVTGLVHRTNALINPAHDLSVYLSEGDRVRVLVTSIGPQRLSLAMETPVDEAPSGTRRDRPKRRVGTGGADRLHQAGQGTRRR